MNYHKIKQRLEEIRQSIIDENISYGEIAELQSLAQYIDKGDIQLLEVAGVPEFPKEMSDRLKIRITEENLCLTKNSRQY